MRHLLHCRRRTALAAILAAAFLPIFAEAANADDVEQFYNGKSIRVVIGHSAGGGYDLYARLLSKHLRKHIPGQPTIVPQSMTGAGGLRVTNYLYEAAPKDGTVIGTFSRSIPTIPLITPPGTFDARKFAWLGSMSSETSLCLTGGKSAVKTWQDMLTRPSIMGGQAAGTDSDIYARLYKNVLGAQIRIVSGYPGTTEITLAMERGEVDGICGLSWGTVKVSHPGWRKNKSVNFLLQAGLKKDPDLPDVPFAMDLVDEPEKKQILYLHFAPQAMGRPFAAPPDIPADRKAALIKAFDETLKDPELLAEAAKLRMDIDPMTGSQIDQLLARIYATPPDVVAKAANAIAE
jgi:tripartite-type tricarboxylate transporter receptor subunit TctC